MKYDLVVIGAGPAGYVAAIRAAKLGLKTAVVEKGEVGGTCLNIGCIPTKQWFASASQLRQCREAAQYGLTVKDVAVDAELLQKNKKKIVRTLTGGVASLLKANGVEHINGEAKIVRAGVVEVKASDDTIRTLLTEKTLIATGSVPLPLSVSGGDLPAVIDSTGALALESIPARLVIVGAGVIGVEFAGIYRAFGSEVTMVELLPAILPAMDMEASKAVQKSLEKQGIRILLKTKVESITTVGTNTLVNLGGGESIACDLVLNATGRKPLTTGLGLEGVNIKVNRDGFIEVDDNYETNVKGIYAVGDVISGPMLAHVASAEAVAAVERMAGHDSAVDYDLVPQSVFTFPEYSMIGLTEEEALERYSDVKISRFFFRGNGKALSMNDAEGFVKVIASSDLARILGIHIVGPHANDLIAEAAAAMNAMLTVEEYAGIMRGHPTLPEALFEASSDLLGKAIHVAPSKRKKEVTS